MERERNICAERARERACANRMKRLSEVEGSGIVNMELDAEPVGV